MKISVITSAFISSIGIGWLISVAPGALQGMRVAAYVEFNKPAFVLPIQEGELTSDYGPRTHPVTCEVGKLHKGVDIAAPVGTPILAAADGTVRWAGDANDGYGNKVILSHANPADHETLYGHASKLLVQAGQEVEKGDVIAQVGSTGLSTGPHLHFEIILNGDAVDPKIYLDFSQFPRVPVATNCS